MTTGRIRANEWTKVAWGWGKYTVNYRASIGAGGGEYRCYSAPSPWPIASGSLPRQVTHTVIGYGDIWLYSPVESSWYLEPLS